MFGCFVMSILLILGSVDVAFLQPTFELCQPFGSGAIRLLALQHLAFRSSRSVDGLVVRPHVVCIVEIGLLVGIGLALGQGHIVAFRRTPFVWLQDNYLQFWFGGSLVWNHGRGRLRLWLEVVSDILVGPTFTSNGATAPQTVQPVTVFPHLDGSILRRGSVQVAVRGECDGPDRTVMALVDILDGAVLVRLLR